MRIGVLTFHNTPNFGATLQCYALTRYLSGLGHDVEVINYMPPHNMAQYVKALFLGKRRSVRNVGRIGAFRNFLRDNVKLSGAPIFTHRGLRTLSKRYDLTFTGSDEVWKVDHMRQLDASFYLDFCDPATTYTASYAASASTVTNLRDYAAEVTPLLQRLGGISVRDPATAAMVADLTGRDSTEVVDPTMIWDFGAEALPPLRTKPYLALYAWLDPKRFADVEAFADRNGLEIISVGCRNKGSKANYMGIGPQQWMQLMQHSAVIVTDFFHGVVFAMLYRRPFYAFVDKAKRMKLQHVLDIVEEGHRLNESTSALSGRSPGDLTPDWGRIDEKLAPRRAISTAFIADQIAAAAGRS